MERKSKENGKQADRRRSRRIFVPMPVVVRSAAGASRKFEEETHTLRVNAAGGLVALAAPVRRGQKVMVTNKTSGASQECRVVFVGPKQGRKNEVGVVLLRAAPSFWEMPAEEDRRHADRRGTKRIFVPVALIARGRGADRKSFREETHTLRVNANGALISLSAAVKMGQKIVITNRATKQEQDCHVVFVGPRMPGKTPKSEVGIRLLGAAPDFWRHLKA